MNENQPYIEVTEGDIKKLAPKAKREYITALLGGLSQLRAAGILENEHRWCHFVAQCAHETGGFTITRESLTYTSAKRLREVWPARFRNKTDAELAPYLHNPKALGECVYGGRMGNVAPSDGYDFRGSFWLQTTGREAVVKYAAACGLDPSPALLDDVNVTLQFACLEWQQSGCNEWADENDLTKVSKAINTGSATSNVKPVGLAERQEWFAKAWAIWGGKGKADKPAKSMSIKDAFLKVAAPVATGTAAVGEVVKSGVPAVPSVATDSVKHVEEWRGIGRNVWSLGTELAGVASLVGRLWPYVMVAGLAGSVLAFLAWRRREQAS